MLSHATYIYICVYTCISVLCRRQVLYTVWKDSRAYSMSAFGVCVCTGICYIYIHIDIHIYIYIVSSVYTQCVLTCMSLRQETSEASAHSDVESEAGA